MNCPVCTKQMTSAIHEGLEHEVCYICKRCSCYIRTPINADNVIYYHVDFPKLGLFISENRPPSSKEIYFEERYGHSKQLNYYSLTKFMVPNSWDQKGFEYLAAKIRKLGNFK